MTTLQERVADYMVLNSRIDLIFEAIMTETTFHDIRALALTYRLVVR